MPKFLNYGKNDYTEPVIKIFERRNFKTDYSECKVILPEKYKNESWLECRLNPILNHIQRIIEKIQKMDNGCGYKISKNAHNIRFSKRYFFKENGATKKNKRFGHLFCQSEEECKQRLIQHIWLKYIWRRYHPN